MLLKGIVVTDDANFLPLEHQKLINWSSCCFAWEYDSTDDNYAINVRLPKPYIILEICIFLTITITSEREYEHDMTLTIASMEMAIIHVACNYRLNVGENLSLILFKFTPN